MSEAGPTVGRRRRIAAGLVAACLSLVALVAMWAWRTVARLDLPALAEPSLLYAAGRPLEPGLSVIAADLAGALRRLGYREVTNAPQFPGEFRREAGAWDLFLRRSPNPSAPHPAIRLRFTLEGDRIASVVNVSDGTPLDAISLEPELLGEIDQLGSQLRKPVPLSAVPRHLIAAILAAEDHRFADHRGLDPRAVARAVWRNLRHRRIVEGGSTLTQQLIKNLAGAGRQRSWIHKVREAVLAVALERRYSKRDILLAYLNSVYLGHHGPLEVHGVGAAAAVYFQKDVGQLDVAESALLAGMISGPNRYSPLQHPDRARVRRDIVLRRMRTLGFVSETVLAQLTQRPVVVEPIPPHPRFAAHFLDGVLGELEHRRQASGGRGGGLRIYTTLDPALQHAAEETVARNLEGLERRYPELRHPDPAKRLQGVLIALDPRTGGIRALVGGRDYWLSQFNRASQAHRQPGSTFKPFVYLAALRGGPRGEPPRLTASSLVEDGPVTVDLGPETWTLHNRRGFFLGPVTVRQALQISLNAPAVRTAQMLGLDAVIRTARDVGFTSPFPPHLALALGGVEVVPLELAAAYATLANSGTRVVPTTIEAIADGNGMLASEARQLTRRVIQSEEAFVVNNLLVGVMQSGTGAMAKVRGVEGEVAGKTGSTRRDAWLVGYTPRLVTLVWIGFDGGDPIRLTGARGALPMWVDFMRSAMTIVPSPKGVTRLSGYAFADFADHLTCYDVKPSEAAPKVVVRLFDQFFPTGQNAEVRQLRLLCTPAIKLK